MYILQFFNKVNFQDAFIEKSDALFLYIIQIIMTNEILIKNLTLSQLDMSTTSTDSIIFLDTFDQGKVTVSNLNVIDCNIASRDVLFYWLIGSGNFTLDSVTFKNITMDSWASLISAESVHNFWINNSSFKQISQVESSDISNVMLKISSMNLDSVGSFLMNNIEVEESSVSLFDMKNIHNLNTLGKSLTIAGLSYTNSVIEFKQNFITFGEIETSTDFEIVIDNVTMKNLTFTRNGYLFKFQQQTATDLILSNCYFYGLNGGSIYIGSANLQNSDIRTKVTMKNITANSLNGNTNSFISINEGGYLTIYNSKFSNIYTVERGAVLNAGYKNSISEVHNSTFQNNTSLIGSIANVQDGSVIKFYD